MTDSEKALAQEILDQLGEFRSEIREMAQESREAGERLHKEIQQEMKDFSDELRSLGEKLDDGFARTESKIEQMVAELKKKRSDS